MYSIGLAYSLCVQRPYIGQVDSVYNLSKTGTKVLSMTFDTPVIHLSAISMFVLCGVTTSFV